MHFPLGVFAVAVGTAVLPRASEAVARGQRSDLEATYGDGLRLACFLVIPAALFLMVFPREVVSLVYEHGAFSAADTEATAAALRFYALGLLSYTGVRVTAPFFYAHKDTRTPVRYAMAAVALNVVLNLALAPPLGVAGLALANAVSGTANFLLLGRRLRTQYGLAVTPGVRQDLAGFLIAGVAASALAFGASLYVRGGSGLAQQLVSLGVAGGVFLLVYAAPILRRDSAARAVARQLLRRG
jgi:putative peptidoglycan lipid II flippase